MHSKQTINPFGDEPVEKDEVEMSPIHPTHMLHTVKVLGAFSFQYQCTQNCEYVTVKGNASKHSPDLFPFSYMLNIDTFLQLHYALS